MCAPRAAKGVSYHSILTLNSPAPKGSLINMNARSATRILTQSLPALSKLLKFLSLKMQTEDCP